MRSFWGAGGGSQGRRGLIDSPKPIGGYTEGSGHTSVALYHPGDRKPKRFKTHTLVLEAFVGPKPPRMFACHIDGNRQNNHASNLRWDTAGANARDRVKHKGR